MPIVMIIMSFENIVMAIIEGRNILTNLLIPKFCNDLPHIISYKKSSKELSTLISRKDKKLYTYYFQLENLLKIFIKTIR